MSESIWIVLLILRLNTRSTHLRCLLLFKFIVKKEKSA